MMLQTMKSKEYRQYLQQVLTETAESPLFQAKMIDIISKGVQKLKKADLVRKKQAVTVVLKAGRRKNSKIITIITSGQFIHCSLVITLSCY